MSWLVTAIVASTAITAYSQVKEGDDALAQAQRDKKQYDLDAQLSLIETKQNSNLRMTDWLDASNSNEAWFSYLGRDITQDRSVKAFLEKEGKIAMEDMVRNNFQGKLEAQKISNVGRDVLTAGYNARTAGYLNATATIFSGVSSLKKTQTPKNTTTTQTKPVSYSTRIKQA
tara:strand:+ start:69 stop:584 length:516 start_codon:yes stop_codon:yes gene_type:complete